MPVSYPDVATLVKRLGKGIVLTGDPTTDSGLSVLGIVEGEITPEWNEEFSDLTAPDQLGPAVLERKLRGMNPRLTIPLIIGDAALLATLSPTGVAHGGHEKDQDAVTTSVVVVPEDEFGDTFEFTTGVWTPAAPTKAMWLWKASFERPGITYKAADGEKDVEDVIAQCHWDASKPDGHHLFTFGDPDSFGITIDI